LKNTEMRQKNPIKDRKKRSVPRHMTVRIPRGMAIEIERFLNTEQADRMGFDSKADVVTAAVRLLLRDYGYYRAPQKVKREVQIP